MPPKNLRADAAVFQLSADFTKLRHRLFLPAVGHHGFVAGDHLLDVAVEPAEQRLLPDKISAHEFGHGDARDKAERHGNHTDECQQRIVAQHDDQGAGDGQHAGKQRGD